MTVCARGRPVSSPSGVCNADVRVKLHCKVRAGSINELLQLGHLTNLFEGIDFILLVSINCESSRIISAIF